MLVLRNFNFKENIKFPFFLKTFTFILLICVYYLQNDMLIPGQSIQKRHNSDENFYVTFNRLLAKNELQRQLYHDRTNDYTRYDIGNKRSKNNTYTQSTYAHIKKRDFDILDTYKKNYKSRYSKKKGLAKLDCYFEKKLFDQIDYINGLAEKWQKDKNSFKKKILKKYGIYFLLFALVPMLGFIYPSLLWGDTAKDRIFKWCGWYGKYHKLDQLPCSKGGLYHYSSDIIYGLYYFNIVLFHLFNIISFSFIIYTFLKVIKYEKMKEGKGKMNKKEYIDFCKDVFNMKK
ncbi:hypothetical protein PVIIG_05699 [Plasmodium vivax India VII]|uniref:Fam-l protein n=1 Tax=Plasmodium vivax India VII TaxID=1077284 RepID=A0A0J9UTV2_PLAVI|nr:hypothetical protein PVIIG_05699 [Plasmodium vivax India VII]